MSDVNSNSCRACRDRHRKCTEQCVLAPYFPADQPQKYYNVRRVFGALRIQRALANLPMDSRRDAAESMAYEAAARVNDPVYGSYGEVLNLYRQIEQMQVELARVSHLVRNARLQAGAMLTAPGNCVTQNLPSSSLSSSVD
ncbi:unnamed protein product [Calypogeia fissa]